MVDVGDEEVERAVLVHNEKLKLRATYLNGLAIAIFAVGGFAPVITAIATLSSPNPILGALSGVCFVISFSLHYYAMSSLGALRS